MTLSLVKTGRLWYTVAMKVLLSFLKPLTLCLLPLLSLCLISCTPQRVVADDALAVREEDGEDTLTILFPVYSYGRLVDDMSFVHVCESEHAIAYVSAHAVDDARMQELLDTFEETIYPALPVPFILETNKLNILLSCMEGNVYGYMPSEGQTGEHGPVVYLNALFPDDLVYTLAHEYQHLCAFDACRIGETSLSEETDELLSDMFTESLFHGLGRERGILSKERSMIAQKRIDDWGRDALSHAYELLRAGYAEKDLLLALENH